MIDLPNSLLNSRLLQPELIWLEPDQMEQAKALSEHAASESQQWQNYLNALAVVGFAQWLSDRLIGHSIQRSPKSTQLICYVEVSGFTFGLIAVEHVLDEIMAIPQIAVEQPEWVAHFYVLHEVSEEQELVTVRGFCRYDELLNYCDRHPEQPQAGYYQLPLTFLDAEPNHLLFYCRFLQPDAIPLPSRVSTSITDYASITLANTPTRLTQWLQNVFDQNWQAIDQLINPDAYLTFSIRAIETGVRRGKLINFGVQFGQQAVALLVNVTLETAGKLGVLVQLHPVGANRYLMTNLKLSLRSPTGKTLQEVTARSQDNYIQLKPFKGNPGTRFSITIQFESETIEENFEL